MTNITKRTHCPVKFSTYKHMRFLFGLCVLKMLFLQKFLKYFIVFCVH